MPLRDDAIKAVKADGGKWLLRPYMPPEERKTAYPKDEIPESPETAEDRAKAVLRNIESALSALITPNADKAAYTGNDVMYAVKLADIVTARRDALRDKARLEHFDETLRNSVKRHGFEEAAEQLVYNMGL